MTSITKKFFSKSFVRRVYRNTARNGIRGFVRVALLPFCAPQTPDGIEICKIKTYDGYNQNVHPSILKTNTGYALAITPYPFGDARYENPCIYLSDDGVNFYPPKGCINPLVVPTGDKMTHLSDPHLSFDETSRTYTLCYRESCYKNSVFLYDHFYITESTNLSLWSNPKELVKFENCERILSPSIVKHNGKRKLYYIRVKESKYTLECADMNAISKTAMQLNVDNMPDNKRLWHVDILNDNDLLRSLFLLTNDTETDFSLYYAQSANGLNWTIKGPIMLRDTYPTYFKFEYKSALSRQEDGKFTIHCSAKTVRDSFYTYIIRDCQL